ncbi:MAG: hypothetical protein AB2693_13375, partial [Candidatus Thiodiazotropha sp.]
SRHNCPMNGTIWFHNAVITLKDAAGMANSIGIDQTALLRAVRSMPVLFAKAYLSQYIEFLW